MRKLKFKASIDHHVQWVDGTDEYGERKGREVPCLGLKFMNRGELGLFVSIEEYLSDTAGAIDLSEISLSAHVGPNSSAYAFSYGHPIASKLIAAGCGSIESGQFVVKDEFEKKYKSEKIRLSVSKLLDNIREGR